MPISTYARFGSHNRPALNTHIVRVYNRNKTENTKKRSEKLGLDHTQKDKGGQAARRHSSKVNVLVLKQRDRWVHEK